MTAPKPRALRRLIDSSGAAVWVISSAGTLVYLSPATESWLGVDPASLLNRKSIAGAAITDDPLDRLAASLSPPPGFAARGTAMLRITPPSPSDSTSPGEPMETRFVRLGDDPSSSLTIAVAGRFDDRNVDRKILDAVAIRKRLDQWRSQMTAGAALVTSGDSPSAIRLRHRLHVASLARVDILLTGPRGCGSEMIADSIRCADGSGEPVVWVEGSLMDTELLDVTLSPLTDTLIESATAQGTAIIRGLDQMPIEAQWKLHQWRMQLDGRMRLIGLASDRCTLVSDQDADRENADHLNADHENGALVDSDPWAGAEPTDLSTRLADLFCAMTIGIDSLSQRVDDIPLLFQAILADLRARGKTTADRVNRAALDALVIYPWPGEFDELQQAANHASRSATSDVIAMEHLPLAIRSYRPGNPLKQTKNVTADLDEAVKRYELRLIREAVEAAEGNRAEAARRLGISRARLLRKLEANP